MTSMLKWIGISGGDKKATEAGSEWLDRTGEERFYGFENYGNTCYCNSVLQALYYCQPFRECVTEYTPLMLGPNYSKVGSATASPINAAPPKTSTFDFRRDKKKEAPLAATALTLKSASEAKTEKEALEFLEAEETLLSTLKDLFLKIQAQKKRTGIIGPQQFVTRLRKESELFRSNMHQDAHEFFNFTLNTIGETLIRQQKELKRFRHANGRPSLDAPGDSSPDMPAAQTTKPDAENNTWIHKLFEGQLVNETRCLTCETISSRDEPFLDLSIDVEQHASLSTCLRNFSTSETLCSKNKFFCDTCCSLQEAEKRMKIKKLPNILAIHLKRFKYQEKLQRYTKLSYRVVFPLELRVFNTSDDAENADRLYNLFAVIVHIGSGPYHGHYITLAKTHDQWVVFDDDTVEAVDEAYLQRFFGDMNQSGSGYIFFYAAADFDSGEILRSMSNGGTASSSPVPMPGKLADPEPVTNGHSVENREARPSQDRQRGTSPAKGRTSLAVDGVAGMSNGDPVPALLVPSVVTMTPPRSARPTSAGIPVSPSASSVSDSGSNGVGKKKGKGEQNGDSGAFGWLPFGRKKT